MSLQFAQCIAYLYLGIVCEAVFRAEAGVCRHLIEPVENYEWVGAFRHVSGDLNLLLQQR